MAGGHQGQGEERGVVGLCGGGKEALRQAGMRDFGPKDLEKASWVFHGIKSIFCSALTFSQKPITVSISDN